MDIKGGVSDISIQIDVPVHRLCVKGPMTLEFRGGGIVCGNERGITYSITGGLLEINVVGRTKNAGLRRSHNRRSKTHIQTQILFDLKAVLSFELRNGCVCSASGMGIFAMNTCLFCDSSMLTLEGPVFQPGSSVLINAIQHCAVRLLDGKNCPVQSMGVVIGPCCAVELSEEPTWDFHIDTTGNGEISRTEKRKKICYRSNDQPPSPRLD